MPNKKKARQIAYYGMLVALALVLSWLEAQFSAFIPIPGIKLGLTNLVVLCALYLMGESEAIVLNIVRICLVSITFGNTFSFVYSIAGGIFSGVVMLLAKRFKILGVTGVSVAGGVAHNMAQIIVAMFILETKQLVFYLPILWIGGIIAGMVIGIIGGQLMKRIPKLIIS